LRIIGGTFKGLRLSKVGKGDAQAHLRPTSDRVRESIFNILLNGGYGDLVAGARILDLFAGTGALGLEALSRGAARAVFVDSGATAAALLQRNVDLCNAGENTQIIRSDALHCKLPRPKFDLVFMDPPYGKGLGHRALAHLQAMQYLSTGAFVVWEESAAQSAPDDFDLRDTRRFGGTFIHILQAV